MSQADAEVLAAAAALVAAFGAHDTERYFDAFAPEATFLFHSTPAMLATRAAYREDWQSWEDDGFRVLSCRSTDQRVQVLGEGVAVFTHRVATRIRDATGEHDLAERETIVLRRMDDGRWLGMHEHLSPAP